MDNFAKEVGDRLQEVVDKVPGATLERNVTIGGKSSKPKEKNVSEGNVAADQLRLFIERIERLEEEKKGMADDIRDVYSEAKSQGYDAKIMRQCVRLRKMESHDRQEAQAILETYCSALGIQGVLGL